MMPQLLDVMCQRDYLNLAAKGVWYAAQKEIDVSGAMTMMSVPEWYPEKNVGYSQYTYIGPSYGNLVIHHFVLGRNFLVKSAEGKAEWAAVADDFLESAIWAVERATKRIREKCHSDHTHLFSFYYASNLDLAYAPTRRGKIGKYFHRIRGEIDSRVCQLRGVSFGPEEIRTRASLFSNEYLCEQFEAIELLGIDDFEEFYENNRRYLFDLQGKHLTIAPVMLGGMHGLPDQETDSPMQLAKASFATTERSTVTEEALSELELLVASKKAKESDFQQYFERFPALLGDGREWRVYPQVAFVRDDRSTVRPDFFLEPIGHASNVSILDIKRPVEKVVLTKKNRPRFYAKIYEYAAQVREYARYLDNPSHRAWVQEKYGVKGLCPRMVLVVGRDYGVRDYALVNRVKQSIFPVEIKTYSEIIDFGRDLLRRSQKKGARRAAQSSQQPDVRAKCN